MLMKKEKHNKVVACERSRNKKKWKSKKCIETVVFQLSKRKWTLQVSCTHWSRMDYYYSNKSLQMTNITWKITGNEVSAISSHSHSHTRILLYYPVDNSCIQFIPYSIVYMFWTWHTYMWIFLYLPQSKYKRIHWHVISPYAVTY